MYLPLFISSVKLNRTENIFKVEDFIPVSRQEAGSKDEMACPPHRG